MQSAILRKSNSAAPAPCQLLSPVIAVAFAIVSLRRGVIENLRTGETVRNIVGDLKPAKGREKACNERVMDLYRQQLRGADGRLRGVCISRDIVSRLQYKQVVALTQSRGLAIELNCAR